MPSDIESSGTNDFSLLLIRASDGKFLVKEVSSSFQQRTTKYKKQKNVYRRTI